MRIDINKKIKVRTFELGKGYLMEAVQTALVASLTDIGSGIMSVLTLVLPIALGIVGAVMVVIFGVKLFKKLTGKA